MSKPQSKTSIAILAVVIVAMVAVAGFLYWRNVQAPAAMASDYQAVFLSNGQVYFGKLSNRNSLYPTLTDIYYLKVQKTLQPIQDTDKARVQQDIKLIKLGNELHGPADQMQILRDHILFIEDLKIDSKVVEAIERYKATGADEAIPAEGEGEGEGEGEME